MPLSRTDCTSSSSDEDADDDNEEVVHDSGDEDDDVEVMVAVQQYFPMAARAPALNLTPHFLL